MALHWINREYGGGQRDPKDPNGGPTQDEPSESNTAYDIPF